MTFPTDNQTLKQFLAMLIHDPMVAGMKGNVKVKLHIYNYHEPYTGNILSVRHDFLIFKNEADDSDSYLAIPLDFIYAVEFNKYQIED